MLEVFQGFAAAQSELEMKKKDHYPWGEMD